MLCLTQCRTGGGSYQDIEYDPTTLKTPSGHGMEKRDYPFDDDGNYRKDWVKNKTRGKTRSSNKLADPEYGTSSSTAANGGQPPGGTAYAGPAAAPAPPAPPATPSAPAKPSYHKVVSGDTLYSLSQRYGTSVAELKRVNGLTSDSIRVGQSLRVP